jgi:hypothetical protein
MKSKLTKQERLDYVEGMRECKDEGYIGEYEQRLLDGETPQEIMEDYDLAMQQVEIDFTTDMCTNDFAKMFPDLKRNEEYWKMMNIFLKGCQHWRRIPQRVFGKEEK